MDSHFPQFAEQVKNCNNDGKKVIKCKLHNCVQNLCMDDSNYNNKV